MKGKSKKKMMPAMLKPQKVMPMSKGKKKKGMSDMAMLGKRMPM